MHDTYVVSEKKAMLGIEIAKREKAQLDKLDYENGYSLYIGIPFCPTTCSYCSFTSYPVAKWQDRMDEYVDALLKELAFIAEVSKEKHLNAIIWEAVRDNLECTADGPGFEFPGRTFFL